MIHSIDDHEADISNLTTELHDLRIRVSKVEETLSHLIECCNSNTDKLEKELDSVKKYLNKVRNYMTGLYILAGINCLLVLGMIVFLLVKVVERNH